MVRAHSGSVSNSSSREQDSEAAWSGTKPVMQYFRIFGCLAHVHIADQKKMKLMIRAESVFL